MGKIIHRWRKWLDWNDYAKEKYSWVKRFLIFLGIIHNDWFEHFVNWYNWYNEPLTEIENKTSPIMEMKTPSFSWQFTKEDLENNDVSPKWENGVEIRFDD